MLALQALLPASQLHCLLHISAGTNMSAVVLACVKLLKIAGTFAKLMELHPCKHHHCRACDCSVLHPVPF